MISPGRGVDVPSGRAAFPPPGGRRAGIAGAGAQRKRPVTGRRAVLDSTGMPVDRRLRIASHEELGASHFLLSLNTGGGDSLPGWEPGQFSMITLGASAGVDPLLRRPFSIFNEPTPGGDTLQIFYKVLGRGTAILSRARPGDSIDCLAPLGNGFEPRRTGGTRLLLVAGGIGAASLHPLALADRRRGGSPVVLYGCRTDVECAGIRPTRDAGIEVHVATDDGSEGHRGFVSSLLDDFLARNDPAGWTICACGPTPMMKATAEVASRHGVACHLSLESPMACGFGVCVGCVVGVRDHAGGPRRWARICVEGPVFDAARVCW